MNNKKGIKALLLIALFSMTLSACTFIPEDLNSNISGGVVESGYETEHFKVSYYNYDESFLWSSYVQKNTRAEYRGPNPTKNADDEFTYSFDGWVARDGIQYGDLVTKDCSYIAKFTSMPVERYVCYFYNYDGSYLYETLVKAGDSAIYIGPTPTRPDEGDIKYTFIGWDKSTRDIRGQTAFIATYSSMNPTFVVRFFNYDGTMLDIKQVPYGDSVTYDGPTPSKPSEEDKSYRFVRWDKPLENITQNTDINAVFETESRLVNVRFLNADGTVLQSMSVSYGDIPKYTGSTPMKESQGRIGYEFDKWSIENEPVFINTDIVAIFKEVERNYTTGLSFSFDEGTESYEVHGYNGSNNEVYIPLTYNGSRGEYPVTRIGNSAFATKNITSVIMGENVSEIGDSAFLDCKKLKTIDFSKNLRKIGGYAFSGCSALESLEFPKYVNDLVRETFSGFNLEILRISSDNKFYSIVDGFLLNGAHTTVYFPVEERYYNELVIPDGVKIVAARAFKNSQINKVVFPSSLERLGTESFANISTLKEIEFLDSECILESSCFENCYSLQTINLGSNVETVKAKAFRGSNISSLKISKECTAFDLTAIDNCSNLAEISVEEGNSKFSAYDGALYLKGFTSLIYLPPAKRGTLKLNKALEDLKDASFKQCSIESFEVDEENTKLASYKGVVYSKDLKTLILAPRLLPAFEAPDALEEISSGAFENCSELLTINLSNTSMKEVSEGAFLNCGNIRTVVLPNTVEKICDNAFKSCVALNSINFDEGLIRIGASSFEGCRSLTNITIPNSVEKIDENAFYSSGITTLTLGSGLIDIGEFAFSNCNNLGSAIIPNSVTSIGNSAFANCSKLKTLTIGNGCSSIGNYSFAKCGALTSVSISSDNISSGGTNIFEDCISLTDVDLGNGFSTIPSSMFKGCSLLSTINIPNSVTTLNESVFENCTSLDTFVPGDSLKVIRDNTFKNCTSLVNVSLGDNLLELTNTSFSGCTRLETLDLGKRIETIPENAFSYIGGLKSFTIPDSVITLGEGIFKGNKTIESVTIGKSLTALPSYTFSECQNLKTINFDNAESLTNIGAYAFEKSGLESITIPNVVTFIDSNAFNLCTQLKTATLSEGLTTLKSGLFSNCTSLESFVVPKNISEFEQDIFYNCPKVTRFEFNDSLTSLPSNVLNGFQNLETVVLPKNCTSLPSSCFRNASKLKNIVLPESITTIPNYCFRNCESLEAIVIPDSVTSIGSYAFAYCYDLTNITLGSNITTINNYAFMYCQSLESIELPNSLTYLSYGTFQYCSSLKTIVLPKQLTSIDSSMFYYCTSLESVDLPINCTSIGNSAFYNCNSLITVNNAEKIEYINGDAFNNCSLLQNINLTDKVKQIYSNAFYECNSLPSTEYKNGRYYKIGSNSYYLLLSLVNKNVESFEMHPDMVMVAGSVFSDSLITQITIPNNFTIIPESMFSNMQYLEEITIPNSVREIGYGAFQNCRKLTSVNIGNSVQTIGGYAFNNCDSLESIYIPDSVTLISDGAFYNCQNLTSVRLSNKLQTMYSSVFSYCTKLEEITLPDSLTYLGDCCFSYTKIASINLPKNLSTLSGGPFRYMSNLSSLTISSDNTNYKAIKNSIYSYNETVLYYYHFDEDQDYVILPKKVTTIIAYAFDYDHAFSKIYFEGSEQECNVSLNWGWIDSNYYGTATWYYYSDTYSLGCWHYNANGVPTIYE